MGATLVGSWVYIFIALGYFGLLISRLVWSCLLVFVFAGLGFLWVLPSALYRGLVDDCIVTSRRKSRNLGGWNKLAETAMHQV